MKLLKSDRYNNPLVGELLMLTDEGRLCYLDFADNDQRRKRLLTTRYGKFPTITSQHMPGLHKRLDDYFAARWDAFDDLELCTDGTDFQQQVWRRLRKIPAGKAISYKQLAHAIHNPRATQAVGGANARNPIAIIIPCHRVIAADGTLGGYAADRVDRKSKLLAHEGVTLRTTKQKPKR